MVSAISRSSGGFPTHEQYEVSAGQRASRRMLDIALGVPLCVVATPIVVVLAVILSLQHRSVGRVAFTHKRIGHRGRILTIPKLRTLRVGSHPYADKTVQTLVPLSRFAAFLRRTHLDEIPQLYLVPFGRLSLVGPRPRMVQEAVECGDEHYNAIRTSIRQGCTGLWQVGAHTAARVSDAPEYDYFYLSQRTLRMDLWIAWRTVAQLVDGKSVSLDHVPAWTLRHRSAPWGSDDAIDSMDACDLDCGDSSRPICAADQATAL